MHCSWRCSGCTSQRAIMTRYCADLSRRRNDQLSPAITVERRETERRGKKRITLSFLPSAIKLFCHGAALYLSFRAHFHGCGSMGLTSGFSIVAS